MPKDEKRSGRKAGERTYVAAAGAALATATAAAAGGGRLCETDFWVLRGTRFPEADARDLAAFNELTLPRGGLDIYAGERAERRRYRAVALFFSYDTASGTPFREYLKRELASARRGRAFA